MLSLRTYNLIIFASHAFIMINRFIFLITSLWLGTTLVIDFAIVPTVFHIIENFFNAGELGIALFRKFNLIECFFALTLLVCALKRGKGFRFFRIHILLVISLAVIILTYVTYLTPKLTLLTDLWKQADAINAIGISGISDIQQEHQLYHRLYVSLDTLKILTLVSLLILDLRFSEDLNGKA